MLHVDIGKEAMVPCTSFISLPANASRCCFQARPAKLGMLPDELLSQSSTALDLIVQKSSQVCCKINGFITINNLRILHSLSLDGC